MRQRFAVVEVAHASEKDHIGYRILATWHIEDLCTGKLVEGPFDSQLAAERWLEHTDWLEKKTGAKKA